MPHQLFRRRSAVSGRRRTPAPSLLASAERAFAAWRTAQTLLDRRVAWSRLCRGQADLLAALSAAHGPAWLADYAAANDDEGTAEDIHGRIIKPHRDKWTG